jgi:cobyrinic acid a,c-diamide synthase
MLHHAASDNDLIIIECTKGLFDGQAGNTSADLARLLGVPIVVVIDAQGVGSIRCSRFHAYFPSNRDAIARFFCAH